MRTVVGRGGGEEAIVRRGRCCCRYLLLPCRACQMCRRACIGAACMKHQARISHRTVSARPKARHGIMCRRPRPRNAGGGRNAWPPIARPIEEGSVCWPMLSRCSRRARVRNGGAAPAGRGIAASSCGAMSGTRGDERGAHGINVGHIAWAASGAASPPPKRPCSATRRHRR